MAHLGHYGRRAPEIVERGPVGSARYSRSVAPSAWTPTPPARHATDITFTTSTVRERVLLVGTFSLPRLRSILITNYRSVAGPIRIDVPSGRPLVLVGENNAGKSNIVRGLELLLGEYWPGNHKPDDHEFFDRDSEGDPIEIRIGVDDVVHAGKYGEQAVSELVWRYPPDEEIGRSLYMVFTDGEPSGFVSNDTREQCICLRVGADRRLSYQLSYTTKWTLLSKLMRQFHKSLTSKPGTVEELQEKFEQIKEIFLSVAPFAAFDSELDRKVEELSGNLTYGLAIDFSAYDPSNFFHALRVLPREGANTRTFEELGTGQEQILAIAFAHAYATAFHGSSRTLILVIEEPEAHLHPLAQRWVAQHLRALARTEGVQVIVTTHSPAFVSVLDLEGLVLVRKEDGSSVVQQLTPTQLATHCQTLGADHATQDTILPFYDVAATNEILAGLFAREVVLVEGPTEAEALPTYLKRVKLDVVKEGIAILPVFGVGNLAKWFRFFSAYDVPVFVIFDNDTKDDAEKERRNDLFDALQLSRETSARLLNATIPAVEQHVAAFGVNFERTLRDLFGDEYASLEKEAAERFGLSQHASKPLVARFVAEGIDQNHESEAWAFFAELAQAISKSNADRMIGGHKQPEEEEEKEEPRGGGGEEEEEEEEEDIPF